MRLKCFFSKVSTESGSSPSENESKIESKWVFQGTKAILCVFKLVAL